jgi:hypothetical protein
MRSCGSPCISCRESDLYFLPLELRLHRSLTLSRRTHPNGQVGSTRQHRDGVPALLNETAMVASGCRAGCARDALVNRTQDHSRACGATEPPPPIRANQTSLPVVGETAVDSDLRGWQRPKRRRHLSSRDEEKPSGGGSDQAAPRACASLKQVRRTLCRTERQTKCEGRHP